MWDAERLRCPLEVLRSPLMLLSSKGVKGCPGRGGRAGWRRPGTEAGAAAWPRGREGAWMLDVWRGALQEPGVDAGCHPQGSGLQLAPHIGLKALCL